MALCVTAVWWWQLQFLLRNPIYPCQILRGYLAVYSYSKLTRSLDGCISLVSCAADSCTALYIVIQTTAIILVAALQYAMIMRLYALHNGNRTILGLYSGLLIFELSATVALLAAGNIILPSWMGSICELLFLLFQTILLAATLHRFYVYCKEAQEQLNLKLWFKEDIAVIIARDNIIFYIVSSLPSVFTAIESTNMSQTMGVVPCNSQWSRLKVWHVISQALQEFLGVIASLSSLCLAVLGPRAILNVKGYNSYIKIYRGAPLIGRVNGANDIELESQITPLRECAATFSG